MEVRLLKPWGMRPAGSILDVSEGVANLWLSQRRCERMVPTEPIDVVIEAPMEKRQTRRRERTTA